MNRIFSLIISVFLLLASSNSFSLTKEDCRERVNNAMHNSDVLRGSEADRYRWAQNAADECFKEIAQSGSQSSRSSSDSGGTGWLWLLGGLALLYWMWYRPDVNGWRVPFMASAEEKAWEEKARREIGVSQQYGGSVDKKAKETLKTTEPKSNKTHASRSELGVADAMARFLADYKDSVKVNAIPDEVVGKIISRYVEMKIADDGVSSNILAQRVAKEFGLKSAQVNQLFVAIYSIKALVDKILSENEFPDVEGLLSHERAEAAIRLISEIGLEGGSFDGDALRERVAAALSAELGSGVKPYISKFFWTRIPMRIRFDPSYIVGDLLISVDLDERKKTVTVAEKEDRPKDAAKEKVMRTAAFRRWFEEDIGDDIDEYDVVRLYLAFKEVKKVAAKENSTEYDDLSQAFIEAWGIDAPTSALSVDEWVAANYKECLSDFNDALENPVPLDKVIGAFEVGFGKLAA